MDLRTGIVQTAGALGVNPLDLATAISYETAGTFDPTKAGPTTQWGRHRGLIQFGEPQAQKYGVDWNDPLGSQLGPDGAVAKYLRDTGVQPGMGLLDIYSAINAGGVGRYNASDANNGGAPGTVRDKVEQQMSGHRKKAAQLLGQQAMAALGKTQEQPMGLLNLSTKGAAAPAEKEKWWTPDRRDSLQLALEGMTLNPNPGIMYAAQARMQGRREDKKTEKAEKQAQERANRTAQWLESRGRSDLAQAVAGGFVDPKAAVSEAMKPPADDRTAMMKNYQFWINQGLSEDEAAQRVRGGQTISVDARQNIKPDTGYRNVYDDNGMLVSQEVIPGGPADREINQDVAATVGAKAKENERDRQTRLKTGQMLGNLNLNIKEIEDGGLPMTGIIGTVGGLVPGTPQADFQSRHSAVTTRAALNEIQNMRDNSPTGGAVGQLTDSERVAIGDAATALRTTTSSAEYLRAAKAFRKLALDIAYKGMDYEFDEKTGEVILKGPSGAQGSGRPPGVTPEEWGAMSDEDRALWQN